MKRKKNYRSNLIRLGPFAADLALLKVLARAEHRISEVGDGGENRAAAGLHGAPQVLIGHAAGAKHVAVGKVLRGHVTDGQLRQHHLSAAQVELLQLFVEDRPLSVHHLLVFLLLAPQTSTVLVNGNISFMFLVGPVQFTAHLIQKTS